MCGDVWNSWPHLEHYQDLYFPAIHTISSPHAAHFLQCPGAGDSSLPAFLHVSSFAKSPRQTALCSQLGEHRGRPRVLGLDYPAPRPQGQRAQARRGPPVGLAAGFLSLPRQLERKKHMRNFSLSQNLIHCKPCSLALYF